MSLQDIDTCISKLRYIPPECADRCSEENFEANKDWCIQNCEARSTDVNMISQCINLIYSYARERGLDPVVLDKVKPYLDKLPSIKSGDILLPDHINSIVDALKALVYAIEEGFKVLMRGAYVSDYTIDLLLLYESGYTNPYLGILLQDRYIYKPVPASGIFMFVDTAQEPFMAIDILASETM